MRYFLGGIYDILYYQVFIHFFNAVYQNWSKLKSRILSFGQLNAPFNKSLCISNNEIEFYAIYELTPRDLPFYKYLPWYKKLISFFIILLFEFLY